MSVTAKMNLEAVVALQWGGVKAIYRCSYDPNLPEDQAFCKATPSGMAEFVVDNPEAIKQLVIGKAYYFTITPCDEVKS